MISARDRILRPYTRRVSDMWHGLIKATAIFLLILTAMVMGFWLAVFGTLMAQPFFGLVGVLFLVALWMVDDTEPDYRGQISKLLLIFLVLEMAWPPYLAIDIPGLPWITPPRLLLAMTIFMALMQFSQSARARGEIASVWAVSRPPIVFYGIFWAFALGSALYGRSPGASIGYSLNQLLLWNMPFVVATWAMMDERFLRRFVALMLITYSVIFVLTVFEYMQRKPVWFDYIPGFLKIDGPLFNVIMADQSRVGDDRYRARGNLAVHLYFAQAFLVVVPFMVHYAFSAKQFRHKAAAIALLLFSLVVSWMTNTRTAMIGFIIMVVGATSLFALRRFLRPPNKADMVAPAMFMAAPAAAMLLLVAIAASPRLQSIMIGGAQHKGSDEVRGQQWDRAINALMTNPLGYGGNNSGPLSGRLTSNGIWIVDSAWINLLLDYGLIAAFCFLMFVALNVIEGVKIYVRAEDESADLCGPAAVALTGFGLTMYTISYFGNFAVMLVLIAGIMGTKFRLSQLDQARSPQLSAMPALLPRRRLV